MGFHYEIVSERVFAVPMINLKGMWEEETVSMSDTDWWKKVRDKHCMIKRAELMLRECRKEAVNN